MRKCLQSLLAVFAISMVCGIVSAQFDEGLDITFLFEKNSTTPKVDGAYNKLLTEYNNERWYEKWQITCNATDSSIVLEFPVIYDVTANDYVEAKWYDIFLSPYRLEELKTRDDIDTSKILKKRVPGDANPEKFSVQLSVSDWLDSNQLYYWFVVPISDYDLVGAPSEEICFHMSNNMCLLDTECDSIASIVWITSDDSQLTHWAAGSEEHGAGDCTSMKYANVKGKQTDDNMIILTWTAVSNWDVDIAILDPDDNQYKSLGSVPMSDEKFEYKMSWNWEYNFAFDNGCDLTPYRFKFDWEMSTGKKTSEKIVTPATGPAENVLYIVIAAIVLYGAYTIFGRKSEN